MVFMPAAWFVAPFGRDSLLVSLQNILIYPEFAGGSLQILGSLQAKEDDPYRDAEPGKILHELRYGELAHFKLIPHTPYYGTAERNAALFDHAARSLARNRRQRVAGAASADGRRMS
jgi:glycogen debranching enzyme